MVLFTMYFLQKNINMSTIKGGEFLIKDIEAKDIFSIEELNEDRKMMRDSAKEFIDREVVPNRERFEKKIMHILKK